MIRPATIGPVPANGRRPQPAPFIVGVSRSGTTLLRMMLDSHPQLAIPFETHFLNRLKDVHGRISKSWFLEVVTSTPSWPNLALDQGELDDRLGPAAEIETADAVRTIYRSLAVREGKPRWGDKTPSYLAIMTSIQDILPEAHFIHIIRDGRDTALSLRGLWFGPGADVRSAARFWVDQIRAAREQAKRLGNYLEIRYEDLLGTPHAVLERICAHIGLPFDPAMLAYPGRAQKRLSEIVRPFGPNGADKLDIDDFRSIYGNTGRPVDPTRAGRWEREMSAVEQQQFESVAGPLLLELGYETRYPLERDRDDGLGGKRGRG